MLFAATLTLTFGNLLPARARRAAREQDLADEAGRNRALELQLLETDRLAERLLRDPMANERVLRDRYRMSAEGEVVVR